jgi:hypothetical protein
MELSDFLERMVAMANEVHAELIDLPDERARYDKVKEIVDGAEVVFAVWQDKSAKGGVGFMLIKGQSMARQVLADNKGGMPARTAAIPCIEAEQAKALLDDLGERDSLH